MHSLSTVLSKNKISVLRTEQTVFPDGTKRESTTCYLPTDLTSFNPKNNRFRPQKSLTDEEQTKLLRTQNISNYTALTKSIKEQPCFEAIKVHFDGTKFIIIDGHRRIQAAKDAGRLDFLAIVYENLNQEQHEFIAEWNEENPTKLNHDAFFKARGIAVPIIEASSDDERNSIVARLKRRNIKQAQIDKAVSTVLFIADFAKKLGEPEEKRSHQYKAFETVAQIKTEQFNTLAAIGEFDKVQKLDELATAFLKENLAHDDIKVALDFLSKNDFTNNLWIQILNKEIDINQQSHLRRIVNEIRFNQSTVDLEAETKSFAQRVYGKILESPDLTTIISVKTEISNLIEKLNLIASSQGVQ